MDEPAEHVLAAIATENLSTPTARLSPRCAATSLATTALLTLLKDDGKIQLPARFCEPALQYLVTYINKLPFESIDTPRTWDTSRDFHLCFAANAIGMRKYTSHILENYKCCLHDGILSYEQLVSTLKVDNPTARRLLTNALY
ncbi:hypothetical protein J1614_005528 [Plenodomus biglobosus]|nr:hypothetical protein J1614_005528 [Plenodomus biglobosus]